MNSSKPIKKGQIEDYISDSTQLALDAIGGGNTNLTYTPSPTQGTVVSDTGTDAVIPLANNTNAGLLSPAEKAQIATALQPGGGTSYTNEEAQDAVGSILTDTATIDLSYNDATPNISADVKPNSIDSTHLSNSINISEFVNDSDYATEAYVDLKTPADYSNIVYVNGLNPNSATIFDLNNPPITNDNTLKTNTANLYIGSDASTWVYQTSPAGYITKTIFGTSNFYLAGGTIDAGSNKSNAIERTGTVGGANATASNHFMTKSQVDALDAGNVKTTGNQTIAGNKTFTGTPTAPTATAGTNTTQVATTEFVQNADAGNVKLTGNQTKDGVLKFINSGNSTINGLQIINNGTSSASINGLNSSSGDLLSISNNSTGQGIRLINNNSGIGLGLGNNGNGYGLYAQSSSTGNSIVSNGLESASGFCFIGQNNGNNTFTVNKLGDVTANSFIKSGGTSSQFLKADGSVDSSISSGTYTPTLTNTTNITSSAHTGSVYTKVGNIVNVRMSYNMNATTINTPTLLTATLPIGRLSSVVQHIGNGIMVRGGGENVYNSTIVSTANNTTEFQIISFPSSLSTLVCTVNYQYSI